MALLIAVLGGAALWAQGGLRWLLGLAGAVALLVMLALARQSRRLRQQRRANRAALHALRQARRQAARTAAERARMMAFITHELRTPLNGLLGMAHLLRGTALTPEQVNYVQAIDGSGRLLKSMVDELLEAARAEATGAADASAPAVKQPFHPARMVEEICELLSPRAHARGLALACFIDPRIDGPWLGDEARLKQVLLNLLGNALKFTREGGVMVRLEPAADAAQGLVLSVADTGPGVPPGMEQQIFQPFAREGGNDVAREGGVGLGLAIVRRLVALMGGRLSLDNRPGEGATFRVHLPLRRAKAATTGDQANERLGKPLAGARVVLVAPRNMHRAVLRDYIAALGGAVEEAAPHDLPRVLARAGSDVIIDAAHAEALADWLRAHGETARARIWLLLTPEERLQHHDLLQHAALAGWLLKPLRRQTLVERLAHGDVESMLNDSVRRLREVAREGQARKERMREGQVRHAPADTETASAHAPLVLLAEDDPVSAQVARIVLERAGCRVAHFTDGAALLKDVRQRLLDASRERPCCALLDMHMPEMDGPETAQAIRQLEHELGAARLPLIALSAADAPEERNRCLAAGMDGFLSKPLEAEELQALLRQLRVEDGDTKPAITRHAPLR